MSEILSSNHKNTVRVIVVALVIGLYVLEGIPINPLIVWTALPVYIGYSMLSKGWRTGSKKKIHQGYGYLFVSLCFSYFYHFAWFFDWEGTKTGGSTSALIFVWFPLYAIVLGYIGYFVGSITGDDYENP